MKIKLISCEALAREFYAAAASSPNVIDTELLAFGLHNIPDDLRAAIQSAIDSTPPLYPPLLRGGEGMYPP